MMRSSTYRSAARESRDDLLVPLYIPDASPVPFTQPDSTLYGVGIADTLNGLVVVVPAYASMAPGDDVRVYWDNALIDVVSTAVTSDNINQQVVMTVPRDVFISETCAPFYRVYRISGGQFDSSPRDILVKLDRPGGLDPDRATPYNENLAAPQLPPGVVAKGVDDAQAALGVDVTIPPYENMAHYDVIRLVWGTSQVSHTVLPADVGAPVVIHMDEAAILDGGDGNICVLYQVVDGVGNFSDGWSLMTVVNVIASSAPLLAPLVAEADENNVLDLNALNGADATVEVWVAPSDFAVGDTVNLLWAGRTQNNAQVDWTSSQVVSKVPDTMNFYVPNATVAVIAQGYAVASYTLVKAATGTVVNSKRTQVMVVGQALMNLPAPTVLEAGNGGLLSFDAAQATVQIAPYLGMAPGDNIELVWAGKRVDGSATDYRDSQQVSAGSVGRTVTFIVPATEVSTLKGGTVDVSYEVTPAVGTTQTSEHLALWVSNVALPAPIVPEAQNGALAADAVQVRVQVLPYPRMAVNDRVDMIWQGDVTGWLTDWLPVTSATVGKSLTFVVYEESIGPDRSVVASYSVTRAAGGGVENSEVLALRVGAAAVPPAPTIDEAQDTQLDPADVPNGATVRVPASANLQGGDYVTVYWQGPTEAASQNVGETVSANTAGKDLTVVVDASVVQASSGTWITLYYVIDRVDSTTETSDSSIYTVGTQIPTAPFTVLGARSARSTQVGTTADLSYLTALQGSAAIDATWQYVGDAQVASGKVFGDTQPARLLQVSHSGRQITLNPANICGNDGAMVARRDEGSVIAWGASTSGGSVPPTILTFDNIVEVVASLDAFCARAANGAVVAWGNSAFGGSVPLDIAQLHDIVQVVSSGGGFAALRANGSVVAWGANGYGVPVPDQISQRTDIVELTGSEGQKGAFAARVQSGGVVAWGPSDNGGVVPSDVAALTNIVEVVGGWTFAARTSNNAVVAWGRAQDGGSVPEAIAQLRNVVEVIPGPTSFCARLDDGSIVEWGDARGAELQPDIAALHDIVSVTASELAYAARRANGAVVAWGQAAWGGSVPTDIALLRDIVNVTATTGAFAALRANGTVVTWGNASYAGDSSAVQSQLINVRAIYGSGWAFAALRNDGRVVTWGAQGSGGDSSAVQNFINGHVTYEFASAQARAKRLEVRRSGRQPSCAAHLNAPSARGKTNVRSSSTT